MRPSRVLEDRRSALVLACALLGLGCGSSNPGSDGDTDPGPGTEGTTTADDAPGLDESTGGEPEPTAAGRCDYTSPFTSAPECREYVGAAWTDPEITAACDDLNGTVGLGQACSADDVLGRCILDGGTDRELHVVAYGTSAEECGTQKLGCETFGGGDWEPAEICGDDDGGGPSGLPVFEPPVLLCSDPLPGEPPGQSEGGQVCTWQMISGCTEEGRRFQDYASCDVVRLQRPYYPAPIPERPAQPDPRMEDPVYVAELDWVRSQVEASACVCCHEESLTPNGPSNWYIDAGGNWMETFYDTGLAFGAGYIDSTPLGAYPAEENNGFDRSIGMPSTDPARMQAFFAAEVAYRGLGPEDFVNEQPFGGPLYTQLVYEPEACENGERVDRDGTLHWTGGDARYVYVLDAGSGNPTIPPNLDLPDGTRWRLDVPPDGTPVASGEVTYGDVPAGVSQRYPEAGAPAALQPGQQYYLYVTKDVIQPITRCLFTY